MKRCWRVSGLLLVLVAAILPPVGAQEQRVERRMALPNDAVVTVSGEGGTIEIPFEIINNHLIVPVRVNGSEPLDVVLDTGMPAPGLALHSTEATRALELDVDPSIAARVAGAGSDDEPLMARIAMSESFELPGVRFDQAKIILLPELDGFATYHEGIIGYSLFERFVVEIDYDRRLLVLHEPAAYEPPAGAHVVPLVFHHRVPYATVRISTDAEWFDAEVVVDLGASHAISLNSDELAEIEVPDGAMATLLGRGISGEIEGHAARIRGLDLGGAILENVVAFFPESEDQNPRGLDSLAGNLGSGVLKRFNTTFDYANSRMLLVPNETHQESFRFDRSGLVFGYSGELEIAQILPSSPAEERGLKVDDLLTHLDGEPVGRDQFHLVRERLRGDGEVRLTLVRNGEAFERTLTLRPLL